ncbi:P-loop containing nucleoside triphosphate hydrolase protein [Dunaliella salina]|uniref:RNA helicase n=1 Tax=Dunaliella salina TaxID=3046 RepID=A0ABQ7GKQ7_DUNSA|nr:P-loop containing nucleoside triphosphate hydrolase protein [Dunaliella salina]|eukprot:KAF5835198.1 P-loop containing nucleoside triphosphate hydrolase protein [Dunaliella salina]
MPSGSHSRSQSPDRKRVKHEEEVGNRHGDEKADKERSHHKSEKHHKDKSHKSEKHHKDKSHKSEKHHKDRSHKDRDKDDAHRGSKREREEDGKHMDTSPPREHAHEHAFENGSAGKAEVKQEVKEEEMEEAEHKQQQQRQQQQQQQQQQPSKPRVKEEEGEGEEKPPKGSNPANTPPKSEPGKAADKPDKPTAPPTKEPPSNSQPSNGTAPASGRNNNGRAEPLSLEELLKRKKQQQQEEAKPRFLSKKEREALALERLNAARAGVAGAPSAAAAAAGNTRMAANGLPLPPPPPTSSTRDRERDRDYDRDRDRGRERDRERERERDRDRDRRRDRGRETDEERRKLTEEREREKELELIKQQYLGLNKPKKRVVRPSEKFKFNFDWGADEDTSRDLNPLYATPHEATLLFGRGMRAGIDRREQKKRAAEFEADMLRKSREAFGLATDTLQSRNADATRAMVADRYEGADMRVEKHWTEKSLEEMTERDWRIFREDFSISYKGSNTVLPMRNWDELKLPKEIRKAIDKVGYTKPSPIQMAAIPLGLRQRDVIGVAETGSGKTAAFVIPMLNYILKQPPMTEANSADGPYAVVLAPTRELAQQIEEETIKLAHYTNFHTVAIVGGQSIEDQGAKLRKGCEIVIATPMRLLDCLDRAYAVLNQCHYIVLDEADRMIDLGFDPQVERLAKKYLRRPVVVNIGTAGRATDAVTQRVQMVKENEKPARLEQVHSRCRVTNSKSSVRCTVLHGGKQQDQREVSIKGFRDDTFNILIATDVAGRGIDVPDVALVINYDMPNSVEAYTHRIGRTGRAGRKGIAITFLTMGDQEVFYDLNRLLIDCKAAVPPELARHEATKVKPGGLNQRKPDVQYAKK